VVIFQKSVYPGDVTLVAFGEVVVGQVVQTREVFQEIGRILVAHV
jgi:hypothetical protein